MTTPIYNRMIVVVLFTLLLMTTHISKTAYAADSSFSIGVGVSGVLDTTPPSIPTDVRALFVGEDQVVLDWQASTDDVSVAGYVVFRNTIPVATTTDTGFTDEVLDRGTAYQYEVKAFDHSGNYSDFSAAIIVVTESSGGGGSYRPSSGGGAADSEVVTDVVSPTSRVAVSAFVDRAILVWQSTVPAQSQVVWGTSYAYEIGSVQSAEDTTIHVVELSQLLPNTQYYFETTTVFSDGTRQIERGSFMTAAAGVATPTESGAQVDGLYLFEYQQVPGVVLVRVVGNPNAMPADQFDGDVLFEGEPGLISFAQPDASYELALFAFNEEGVVIDAVSLTQGDVISRTGEDGARETAGENRTETDQAAATPSETSWLSSLWQSTTTFFRNVWMWLKGFFYEIA